MDTKGGNKAMEQNSVKLREEELKGGILALESSNQQDGTTKYYLSFVKRECPDDSLFVTFGLLKEAENLYNFLVKLLSETA